MPYLPGGRPECVSSSLYGSRMDKLACKKILVGGSWLRERLSLLVRATVLKRLEDR